MSFKPRLSKPEANNPYYNTIQNNGYSKCIKGNIRKKCYTKYIDVLPNCVGAAWGRFNEIIGENCFKYYSSGNAEDLYFRAISLGLKVGREPKVGAIICWSNGNINNSSDGCGHVGVVEQILDKDTIIIGQSGWSSDKLYWTSVHERGNRNNWTDGDDYSWMKNKYVFQGFIYNPNVSEEESLGVCPYNVPIKSIKKGSKGNSVKWLQWNLYRLGWDIEIDGSFGSKTEAAVKVFQTKNNLVVDGCCGPITKKIILNKR